MLLEVVAHSRNICSDFDAVREADASDLADSRVRLLRSLSGDLHAHAALERRREEAWAVGDRIERAGESDRLRLLLEASAMLLGELIDSRHRFSKQ